MNHPYITNLNGHAKLNKMVNDAEAHRRVKRITGEQPSFFKTIFTRFDKIEKTPTKKADQTVSRVPPVESKPS